MLALSGDCTLEVSGKKGVQARVYHNWHLQATAWKTKENNEKSLQDW